MEMVIRRSAAGLIALLLTGICLTAGCLTASNNEGFAIYLTVGDVPPSKMPALSHIEIAEAPVISTDDIISYNSKTYEIELTEKAFKRVYQLEVPIQGRSFVVCVNRKPIYWGAFWTPISSIYFEGVTMYKPLVDEEPHVVTLELGYPSLAFYEGEDPRNNPEILKSLEQAGKLIN